MTFRDPERKLEGFPNRVKVSHVVGVSPSSKELFFGIKGVTMLPTASQQLVEELAPLEKI